MNVQGGRKIGRGELWIAAELTRRGHLVTQQHPVWRTDAPGQYFVDIALQTIAIEVETALAPPWQIPHRTERAENLIADGWHVAFVWLRKEDPTDELIDELLRYLLDVQAKTHHRYRVLNGAGELVRIGWPDSAGKLIHGEPDERAKYIRPTEWSPEPPEPPTEPKPRPLPVRYDDTPLPDGLIEEHNRISKLWFDYEQTFKEWTEERERRRQPWETLPPVYIEREPRRV